MFIDIILGLVFLAGLLGLAYAVSLKIPKLAGVSDSVIRESLKEDSAKIRLFVLHLKTFYQEDKLKDFFYGILAKLIYKFHIFILRFDNSMLSYLKKIRNSTNGLGLPTNGLNSIKNKEEKIIGEIKKEKELIPKEKITLDGVKTEKRVTTFTDDHWQKLNSALTRTANIQTFVKIPLARKIKTKTPKVDLSEVRLFPPVRRKRKKIAADVENKENNIEAEAV